MRDQDRPIEIVRFWLIADLPHTWFTITSAGGPSVAMRNRKGWDRDPLMDVPAWTSL